MGCGQSKSRGRVDGASDSEQQGSNSPSEGALSRTRPLSMTGLSSADKDDFYGPGTIGVRALYNLINNGVRQKSFEMNRNGNHNLYRAGASVEVSTAQSNCEHHMKWPYFKCTLERSVGMVADLLCLPRPPPPFPRCPTHTHIIIIPDHSPPRSLPALTTRR